ncbi:MAG: enoyl-CoA hydratase-related protein [Pseudomonadota bacterium]
MLGPDRKMREPAIARVNSDANCGGKVIVTCCDLVAAAESARFGWAGPKAGSVDPE